MSRVKPNQKPVNIALQGGGAHGAFAWGVFEDAADEFRKWFPPTVCYRQIVPTEEVITLRLFHREDEPLIRLMLDPAQKKRVDPRASRQVSQTFLSLVAA